MTDHQDLDHPVTREWLGRSVQAALPPGHGLSSLPRLNTDPTGSSGVVKVYFGARCECQTAAVLSVEAGAARTRAEALAAMPALVQKLLAQRDAFRKMPCAAHKSLRTPPQGTGPGEK